VFTAGPGTVELPVIIQPETGIEKKDVRGAGRPVSAGYILACVEQVGEGVLLFRHVPGGILRIRLDIVGVDRDDPDSMLDILDGQFPQALLNMFDKWAMITDEKDKRTAFAPELRQAGLAAGRNVE
jgi:hypothetical protein